MAHRWYVVHAYSGFENKVAQSIREQADKKGMADQISQVMVPTEEVVEVRRGAKVQTERKFFPGYVLVKMDLTDDTWHLVKNTAKVTGFLGGGGRGKPVAISVLTSSRLTSKSSAEKRATTAFTTSWMRGSMTFCSTSSPIRV